MVPGEPSRRRSGRSHEAFGNGRPRGMAITAPVIFAEGGTEPGLHAVWHRRGGRFGGSNRDKCAFQGTTLWIADFAVAGRNQSNSVATVWLRRRVSRP